MDSEVILNANQMFHVEHVNYVFSSIDRYAQSA
jgi:hypothetical protein